MKRKFFFAFILTLLLGMLFCGVALAVSYEGTCGDNVTWWYDSHVGTLAISGTGEMYDYYDFHDIPWYNIRADFYKISVGNGVTRVGYNAFLDCMSVTAAEIADTVTDIGDMAFRGCNSLTRVKLSAHAASIGDYAFRDCASLQEIIFPQSVSSIGAHAFYDCTSLTSVTILNPNAVIGNGTYDDFRDCPDALTLYGHANSTTETYAAAAGLHFEALSLSGSCGANLTYTFDPYSGALSITGTGSMTDYNNYLEVPWFDFKEKVTSLNISPGVTRFGHNAFNGFTGLTTVAIPAGVQSFGAFVFYKCTGLKSIVLPASLTFIDWQAFYKCDNLDVVYYEGTLDQWEAIKIEDTDDGNVWLTDAELVCNVPAPTFRLPAGLTYIEEDAFVGIKAKAVWIPSSVRDIEGDPFEGSDVEYIYGDPHTSIARAFAWLHDYHFVPCTD